MEYEDFEIGIRSDGEALEIAVLSAPLGERPRCRAPRPLDGATVERHLKAAEDRLRRSAEASREAEEPGAAGGPEAEPAAEVPSAAALGESLFRALFVGPVGTLYESCRRHIEPGRRGLRLRLRFDLSDQGAPYLASLPWELLRDPDTGGWLSRDRDTPAVRTLENRLLRRRLTVAPPLRILVVEAAPSTMHRLNLQGEVERVSTALEVQLETKAVELLRLDRATPEALRNALLDGSFHVLHFMGHGGYDPASGNGALFFEEADGTGQQIDGEELADLLKGIPDLRMVVLNACQTARHAGHRGAPVSWGVASAVIERTGMPAVVANQHAISDEAAIEMARHLYGRLAHGDPVDAALCEARLQMSLHNAEWSTPVLFLSAPDGRIFDVAPSPGLPGVTAIRPGGRRPVEPLRLGVRSFDGWAADMEERTDHLLDLTEHFNGRYPKNLDSWQTELFPALRDFLRTHLDPRRPLLLDFAAHSTLAFAAGWVLEAKSGISVRMRQRTQKGEFEWGPDDGTAPSESLWDRVEDAGAGRAGRDLAVAVTITQPAVLTDVRAFVERTGLAVSRIVDASVAEPGQRSVRGGEHAYRLAQALIGRLRQRSPAERGGRVHLFAAAPNAFLFYLGQLARSLGHVVLYEFAFGAPDSLGRYRRSLELPTADEVEEPPVGW